MWSLPGGLHGWHTSLIMIVTRRLVRVRDCSCRQGCQAGTKFQSTACKVAYTAKLPQQPCYVYKTPMLQACVRQAVRWQQLCNLPAKGCCMPNGFS